ncbi:hypothetical protein ACJIZ3_006642 [Penstemon smallii]|uniref:Pectate lyase n=1 Tax=Penstemon smallii TaxID=265156 RepID=A0ABD3S8F5_9LAMI
MTKPTSLFLISCLLVCFISSYNVHAAQNKTKSSYKYSSYPRPSQKLMNIIDSCWRSNPNWASTRKALADCAIGFGSAAIGGKNGAIYVVTDPSDDPINPRPGTLRYGVIQTKPLWIIFAKDMSLTLKNELMVNSYKTIDGRGARVEISNGPCISIDGVTNVIVHGISVHDCKPSKPGMVRSTPDHVGERLGSDGDAIAVFASSNIWIDHSDRGLKVTVAFNHFGPGLVQRLPRLRYGYAHVANNRYDQWLMYAIGGSADPTILSEGNYFAASNDANAKQVTKRETNEAGWKNWKWRSTKDVFVNGAYFVPTGYGSCAPNYLKSQSFVAAAGSLAPALTSDAGPLQCFPRQQC